MCGGLAPNLHHLTAPAEEELELEKAESAAASSPAPAAKPRPAPKPKPAARTAMKQKKKSSEIIKSLNRAGEQREEARKSAPTKKKAKNDAFKDYSF